ncbi:MAG TPA: class I SAM-dependent methyltransferase [Acidimicrobiaceae bacterium]|nr:class I SAM-dependent methyltransferase [Acidimicrobiaceae bacterium]
MDAFLDVFGQTTIAAARSADGTLGPRVLDVGCGCGQTTLQLAAAAGPGGAVLGLDISEPLIDVARRRAGAAGSDSADSAVVDFTAADAQTVDPATLRAGPGREPGFDLVFSRFGVMFFDDPVAAFTRLREVAASRGDSAARGGRLAFACWQETARNPWLTVPNRAAMEVVEFPPRTDGAADPFAFGDPAFVRDLLSTTGWRDVALAPFETEVAVLGGGTAEATAPILMQLGVADDAIAAGAAAGTESAAALAERVEAAVAAALRPYEVDGAVRMPAAAWIVTAQA